MTGFGQGSAEVPGLAVTVLARSVNNRHADIRVRLPESLSGWEAEARRRVAGRVRRGRVDVDLRLRRAEGVAEPVQVNRSLVDGLVATARALGREHGLEGELDVRTVLQFPGVLEPVGELTALDDATRGALETALDRALDTLDGDRLREGDLLRADLVDRIDRMRALVEAIADHASDVPAAMHRKLLERVEALAQGVPIDPGRLSQEAAFLADRADITEEIVRLRGHLEQSRRLLVEPDGEPVGRRLDFLVQEILRETNTIASKSSDLDTSRSAVELKVEIEKVREQVQNLE